MLRFVPLLLGNLKELTEVIYFSRVLQCFAFRVQLLAQSQGQRIKHVEGSLWFVPSPSAGGYLIDVATGRCTCPDSTGSDPSSPAKCKHQWAVELVRGHAEPAPGAELAQAGAELAKAPRLGRMSDFTPEETVNLRRALRFMRIRGGGWKYLLKALRLKERTVIPMATRQKVSARVAVRLARFAGVPLEDLLSGCFPPEGTCPHCGNRPEARPL